MASRSTPPPAPRHVSVSAPSEIDPEVLAAEQTREEEILREARAELTGEDDELAALHEPSSQGIVLDDALVARIEEYEVKYPDLTREEIAEMLGAARSEVVAERKERQRKAILRAERLRLKEEEGLTTGISILDEIVDVDLTHLQTWQSPAVINFKAYYRGQKVRVPRHLANTLLEMMDRGAKQERDIHGESWEDHYRKEHNIPVNSVAARQLLERAM